MGKKQTFDANAFLDGAGSDKEFDANAFLDGQEPLSDPFQSAPPASGEEGLGGPAASPEPSITGAAGAPPPSAMGGLRPFTPEGAAPRSPQMMAPRQEQVVEQPVATQYSLPPEDDPLMGTSDPRYVASSFNVDEAGAAAKSRTDAMESVALKALKNTYGVEAPREGETASETLRAMTSYYDERFANLDKPGVENLKAINEKSSATVQQLASKWSEESKALGEAAKQLEQALPSMMPEEQQMAVNQFNASVERLNQRQGELMDMENAMVRDAQMLALREYDINKDVGSGMGVSALVIPKGIGRMTSGLTSFIIDGMTQLLPAEMIGPDVASGKMTRDQAAKEVKRMMLSDIRRGASEVTRKALDIGTTEEYYQDAATNGPFMAKAMIGLGESAPAMVSPYMTGIFFQTADAIGQEMEGTEYDDISELEKTGLKAALGVPAMLLERFGFRNLAKNSAVTKRILASAIGKLPANASAGQIQRVLDAETRSYLTNAGVRMLGGTLSEAETGGAQTAAEIGVRELYNELKGKEILETPDTWVDIAYNIGEGAALEAAGGGALSIPSAIGAAMRTGSVTKDMDNKRYEAFEALLKDPDYPAAVTSYNEELVKAGKITDAEKQKRDGDLALATKIASMIPDDLPVNNRKQAYDLLLEREGLKKKDSILVAGKVAAINEKLEFLQGVSDAKIEAKTASVSATPAKPADTTEATRNRSGGWSENRASLEERAKALGYPSLRSFNSQTNLSENLKEEETSLRNDYALHMSGVRALNNPDEIVALSDEDFGSWAKANDVDRNDMGHVIREDDIDAAKLRIQVLRDRGLDKQADKESGLLIESRKKDDWTLDSWIDRFGDEDNPAQNDVDEANREAVSFNEKLPKATPRPTQADINATTEVATRGLWTAQKKNEQSATTVTAREGVLRTDVRPEPTQSVRVDDAIQGVSSEMESEPEGDAVDAQAPPTDTGAATILPDAPAQVAPKKDVPAPAYTTRNRKFEVRMVDGQPKATPIVKQEDTWSSLPEGKLRDREQRRSNKAWAQSIRQAEDEYSEFTGAKIERKVPIPKAREEHSVILKKASNADDAELGPMGIALRQIAGTGLTKAEKKNLSPKEQRLKEAESKFNLDAVAKELGWIRNRNEGAQAETRYSEEAKNAKWAVDPRGKLTIEGVAHSMMENGPRDENGDPLVSEQEYREAIIDVFRSHSTKTSAIQALKDLIPETPEERIARMQEEYARNRADGFTEEEEAAVESALDNMTDEELNEVWQLQQQAEKATYNEDDARTDERQAAEQTGEVPTGEEEGGEAGQSEGEAESLTTEDRQSLSDRINKLADDLDAPMAQRQSPERTALESEVASAQKALDKALKDINKRGQSLFSDQEGTDQTSVGDAFDNSTENYDRILGPLRARVAKAKIELAKYDRDSAAGEAAQGVLFQRDDYQGGHRPSENGPQAHDILFDNGEWVAPDDILGPNAARYYGGANVAEAQKAIAILRAIQGNPEAEVTIYRAGPKNELNDGDWITLTKGYAKEHAKHPTDPKKDDPVHSFKVKAKEIRWAGDDLNEFGYFPSEAKAVAQKPTSTAPVKTGKLRTDRVAAALKKLVPNLEVIAPKTKEEYAEAAKDISEGLGSTWGIYDPRTNKLYLNPSSPDLRQTLFHEAAHPIIIALAKNKPELFSKFYEQLRTERGGKYIKFGQQYSDLSEAAQMAEALAEFFGDVAAGKVPVSTKPDSLYQQFKNFIKDILAALGWDMRSIDLSKPTDVREFAAQMKKAFDKGIAIEGFAPLEGSGQAMMQADQAFDGPETPKTPIGDTKTVTVDGKERTVFNSKGKPIHPTVEGVRNFWRWFGDSKVVDEQGRPLVVYHGSQNYVLNSDYEQAYIDLHRTLFPDEKPFMEGDLGYKSADYDRFWKFVNFYENNKHRLSEEVKSKIPKSLLDRLSIGLKKPFEIFDPSMAGSSTGAYDARIGFFFTPDRDFASRFTYRIERDSLTGIEKEYRSGLPHIKEVYLKSTKPVNLHSPKKADVEQWISDGIFPESWGTSSEQLAGVRSHLGSKDYQKFLAGRKDVAVANGYDGVRNKIKYDGRVREEIIVFSPTQIKSATGNYGTFDPNNPSILAQRPYGPMPTDTHKGALNAVAASVRAGDGLSNAIAKGMKEVRKSDWYKALDAIQQAQVEADFKAPIKALATPVDKKPSTAPKKLQKQVMEAAGKKAAPKITVNEVTALKDQIRMEARAARGAVADIRGKQKEFASAIREVMKSLGAKLSPAQAGAIVTRAAKVNLSNPEQVAKYLDYVERVVENANYAGDLIAARSAKRKAQAAARNKKLALNHREALQAAADVDVNLIDDPAVYTDAVRRYLAATAPTTTERYAPADTKAMLDLMEKLQGQVQKAYKELLKEEYGIDDVGELSAKELYDALAAEDIDDFAANLDAAKRQELEERVAKMAEYRKLSLQGYQNADITADQQKMLAALKGANIDRMNLQQQADYIRYADNILTNDVFYGAAYAAAIAENSAQIGDALAVAAKNPVKRLFSKDAAKVFMSQSDAFRFFFGMRPVAAQIQNRMGVGDFIRGKKKWANQSKELGKKMTDFYNDLRKKYKNTYNEGLMTAEGMVSFAIQSVPGQDPETSLSIRKAIIEQDIKVKQESRGALAREGEVAEIVYNEILRDAKTYGEVMNNLKGVYPAAYESVEFLKSVSRPYRDAIKQHTADTWNVGGDYSDPNYIPIRLPNAPNSQAPLSPDGPRNITRPTLRPKQAKGTIERQKYRGLPAGKMIDYNVRHNTFSALSDDLYDLNTSQAQMRVSEFMKMPDANTVFGSRENASFMSEMLQKFMVAQYQTNDEESKYVNAVANTLRSWATVRALGGVLQVAKQLPEAFMQATTILNGRADRMFTNMMRVGQATELLDKYAIGDRAGIQGGSRWEGAVKRHTSELEAAFRNNTITRIKANITEKIGQALMASLSASDSLAAKGAWMALYEQERGRQGHAVTSWAQEAREHDNDQQRKDAALYAESMVDQVMISSDPAKMADIAKKGTEGGKNLVKAVLLPFSSFAMQAASRRTLDLSELYSYGKLKAKGDPKAADLEPGAAARSLLASTIGTATFLASSIYVVGFLRDALGELWDDAFDDDEEGTENLIFATTVLQAMYMMGIMDVDIFRSAQKGQQRRLSYEKSKDKENFEQTEAEKKRVRNMKMFMTRLGTEQIPYLNALQPASDGVVDFLNKMQYNTLVENNDPSVRNKDGSVKKFESWQKDPANTMLYRMGQGWDKDRVPLGMIDVLLQNKEAAMRQYNLLQKTSDENDKADAAPKKKASTEPTSRFR